jgi:predicted transcriptional regulator
LFSNRRRNKRDLLEVLWDVLRVINFGHGRPTQISQLANLTYVRALFILEWLETRGLVEKTETGHQRSRVLWKLTVKGQILIDRMGEIYKVLDLAAYPNDAEIKEDWLQRRVARDSSLNKTFKR